MPPGGTWCEAEAINGRKHRSYERIGGVVVPVAMHSKTHIRFFGAATFRMTYSYAEINGQPVE